MALIGVTNKQAATIPAPPRRRLRRAVVKHKKPLTPECFDKEFWDELCAGLEAHGMTGAQYLQILAEVRDDLRGKSADELLKASGITKADTARAKREGRWIENGGFAV